MRLVAISGSLIIAVSASVLSGAWGHPATERYIPIGKSPGVSGQYSYLGTIEAVDVDGRRVGFDYPEGLHWVRIVDRTRIWLDRTRLGQTNVPGRVRDCVPGRTVEIKFEDAERREVAEWIKIRVPQP